jgi:cholesterol transport system auxiliary component
MNQKPHRYLIAVAAAAVLAGCASSQENRANTIYDFGSNAAATAAAPAAPLPALVVTDATGSAALDSERMFYRLNYADALQARSYAHSRWSTNPLSMVTQRLKARLAQSGMKVLSVTDAAAGIPILRIEVDDFIHAFSSARQSEGQLVLRASLFNGNALVDQRTFSRGTAATSADAGGGARALAASTDTVAADIGAWLSTLDVRRR